MYLFLYITEFSIKKNSNISEVKLDFKPVVQISSFCYKLEATRD